MCSSFQFLTICEDEFKEEGVQNFTDEVPADF